MNSNRCDDPTNPIIRCTIKHGDITELDYYQAGMTIREQFAMAAMQGLLSSAGNPNRKALSHDEVCEFSVNYADLLLEYLEHTQ